MAINVGKVVPRAIVLAILLCLAHSGVAQSQSSAYKLQQAIDLMETQGNYLAAIRLFEELEKVRDRSIAAQSLLYLGLCYEKLGKQQARKAYRRLIRDFPDQRELAAEARARLAALEGSDSNHPVPIAMRRVWAGPEVDSAALSRDLKFISYVDWDTGDLATLDLTTGQRHRLTNKGSWFASDEYALSSVISPDGRNIAYSWQNKQNVLELRIIGTDGGEPRVLSTYEQMRDVDLDDWSGDGRQLLATFTAKDGANSIGLVSPYDGSFRLLKGLDRRHPGWVSFSPDGRFIAYDVPFENAGNHDIFLQAIDGGQEVAAMQHAANALFPVWSPDGSKILFLSNRRGTWDLWLVAVSSGKPVGLPVLVKQDMGRAWPIRLSPAGSLYYGVLTASTDIYIAELNPSTGKITPGPTLASQRSLGGSASPEWSPDGKELAYISQTSLRFETEGSPLTITIRSLETASHREIVPALGYFSRLRWSPDGGSLVVTGRDLTNVGGIYRIDIQTGSVTRIVESKPEQTFPRQVAWRPDGKSIFYVHVGTPIMLRELATGVEREVAPGGDFAISPDAQWLAISGEDPANQWPVLTVVPSSGGEPRRRLSIPERGTHIYSIAWTADGLGVLLAKGSIVMRDRGRELLLFNVQTGELQRVGLIMDGLQDIRVHPDGRRIVFSAGKGEGEIRVLENLVGVLNARR